MVDTALSSTPHLKRHLKADGPIKVLIVEANRVNQLVLARQLEGHSCIVDVANHGIEALDHIRGTEFWRAGRRRSQPDIHKVESVRKRLSVVLVDVEMPVWTG